MPLATYTEAFREYARNAGEEKQDAAWILTPWDTWERNPHYRGPEVRHPEDDSYLYEEQVRIEEEAFGPVVVAKAKIWSDDDIPF